MSEICIPTDLLLGLLTEIGKNRALADHETDIVEAIVCRGHRAAGIRVQWTRRLDRKLLAASETKGGIRTFAVTNNMTAKAAYQRLRKLRDGQKTNGAVLRRVGVS